MRETESPEQKGHIIIHEEGIGVPSPEMIEQRAREIAVIAGRAASDFTDEDFRQAKIDMQDVAEPDDEEQQEEDLPFEPGSGEVLGGQPHHARNFGAGDESTVGEQLIQEGLDEALHDEMLEARKRDVG
jgi:hypothetical protein